MNKINFTECTETRGNTQLLEHNSKVINFPRSPLGAQSMPAGLVQDMHSALPCLRNAVPLQAGKLLSWVSQGNTSCSLPAPAPPGPWPPSQTFETAPWNLPSNPLSSRGWAAVSPTQFLLPSLLPQIRNPLGFQHMLNPLFSPAVLSFFYKFFFSKEDLSAPYPIPTGQEQKLLFLM